MVRVDLDAAYAAEQEKAGPPHEIVFKGQLFYFPAQLKMLPIATLREISRHPEDAFLFLRALLDGHDPGSGERFLALSPTAVHVETLAEEMFKLYGFESLGESSASNSSSDPTSENSRPSSNGTTTSTLVTPASVNEP